jgi:plasmid stabilization system protein ParE
MIYRVEISIPALQDAETIFLWIRDFNLESAKIWYEDLLLAVFSLEDSPRRCAMAPESEALGRELRQLIYGKRSQRYRIIFEVIEDEKIVAIYRVRHCSRQQLNRIDFDVDEPLDD